MWVLHTSQLASALYRAAGGEDVDEILLDLYLGPDTKHEYPE